MSQVALQTQGGISKLRRILSRIGLVLASLLGLFNVVIGVLGVIFPDSGQNASTPESLPMWTTILVLVFGLITVIAIIPAWRGNVKALWAVILSRLIEAWSSLMLPFLPDIREGIWSEVVVIIILGTLASALVALALRRQ